MMILLELDGVMMMVKIVLALNSAIEQSDGGEEEEHSHPPPED